MTITKGAKIGMTLSPQGYYHIVMAMNRPHGGIVSIMQV